MLHATLIRLDEVGSLPDEIYGNPLVVSPNAEMKTSNQDPSNLYFSKGFFASPCIPSWQLHPMIIFLLILSLQKPCMFFKMKIILTTILQLPTNGLFIIKSLYGSTVEEIMTSITGNSIMTQTAQCRTMLRLKGEESLVR